MSFGRLPSLSLAPGALTTVRPENAIHDKLDIQVGTWHLSAATATTLTHYFRSLSFDELALPPTTAAWFNAPNGLPSRPIVRLKSRLSQSGAGRQRPLISGELQTRGSGALDPEGDDRAVRSWSLSLSLNESRYIHHQPTGQVRSPPNEWPQEVALETRSRRLSEVIEHSLDNNDNLIIGRSLHTLAFAVPAGFHIARYWTAVFRHLDQTFASLADDQGLTINCSLSINLRSVETYWEFRANDALSWIDEVQPALNAIGLSIERQWPYVAAGVSGCSKSINIRFSSGVHVVVYAKTNKRLRFEVRHDLTDSNPVLSRHVFADHDDLFQALAQLRQHAADTLNEMFSILSNITISPPSQLGLLQLITHIASGCSSPSSAELILAALATNGFVSSTMSEPIKRDIAALVKSGVLMRVRPNRTTFCLTPDYRHAALRLTQVLRNRGGNF